MRAAHIMRRRRLRIMAAFGFALAAARRGRQPAGLARPASPFLLLAQKKGTKEDGLNTIWLADVARTHARELFNTLSRWPRFAPRSFGEKAAEQTVASETPSRTDGLRRVLATSARQIVFQAICFGYFHLGQQMFRRGTRLLRAAKLASTKVTAGRAHRRALPR